MGPDHLKPYHWKPGQSGNPNGRPPGPTATTVLREMLEANDGEKLREIAMVLLGMAVGGDIKAIREVLDRAYGKPVQAITIAPKNESAAEYIARIFDESQDEPEPAIVPVSKPKAAGRKPRKAKPRKPEK